MLFNSTLAKAKKIYIRTHSNSYENSSSKENNEQPLTGNFEVKLPKISLPKYNGEALMWLEFKDTFEALVHSNPNLTDIQRFHYLRSSLQGVAAKIIHSIEISDTNYFNAWSTICERYNNKDLLIHNHIKAIFELPQITKRNALQLRELTDNLSQHLRTLNKLNLTVQQLFDAVLIYVVKTKLDNKTKQEWQEELSSKKQEAATLDEFKSFLQRKCLNLETLDFEQLKINKPNANLKFKSKSTGLAATTTSTACPFCKGPHNIFKCDDFKNIPLENRYHVMKQQQRCTNCLKTGHTIYNCQSTGCRQCGKRHHTLLHLPKSPTISNTSMNPPVTEAPHTASGLTMTSQRQHASSVLLATAVVLISDSSGKQHQCRALLDSGSQSNIISERFFKKLNIPKHASDINLTGVGRASHHVNATCSINITSKNKKFQTPLSCLIMTDICDNIPYEEVATRNLKIPNNITLVDPTFSKPGSIDLLLGTQIFWKILQEKGLQLQNADLYLQKTKLGWIISGSYHSKGAAKSICNLATNNEIQNQLQRFWEIEGFQAKDDDFDPCEESFKSTTYRDENGRFVVRIPLKESPTSLGDSRNQALKRFYNQERKLQQNPDLKKQYTNFMKEYEALKHMSLSKSSFPEDYFLPHLCIINQNSQTTKVRVVFDGSAATTSGKSVNDIQHVGPNVQSDIFSILLRFRLKPIAVCADVEKMYRQVVVHPEDRFLQKILWREHQNEQIKVYELNRVTYGTASAPFLATRALKELANYTNNQPASYIIKNNFYVDDMVTSFESPTEAIEICREITAVLATAQLPLHKWTSNNPEVLKQLTNTSNIESYHHIHNDDSARTLGLIWNTAADQFEYQMPHFTVQDKMTKRMLLSSISKTFDPLGFLSPITIKSKVLLQKLWKQNLEWDDYLTNDIQQKWKELCEDIHNTTWSIQRCVIRQNQSNIQLHGFADASQDAYGACIYLRNQSNNQIHTNLLCAKTRVCPLKVLSIPRLELCAAHLLAKLLQRVLQDFNISINSCTLWTDSTTVLAWINTPLSSLKIFIKNRVNEINTLTQQHEWRYVPSKQNPADLLSRGVSSKLLKHSSIWWQGPDWLKDNESHWPKKHKKLPTAEKLPETKNVLLATANCASQSTLQCPIDMERFSNINRFRELSLTFFDSYTTRLQTSRQNNKALFRVKKYKIPCINSSNMLNQSTLKKKFTT